MFFYVVDIFYYYYQYRNVPRGQVDRSLSETSPAGNCCEWPRRIDQLSANHKSPKAAMEHINSGRHTWAKQHAKANDNMSSTTTTSAGGMEYTRLGNTGLQVSRICLGMMSYGKVPP
jgi:hypothetical protein